jgi:hypothetical protein
MEEDQTHTSPPLTEKLRQGRDWGGKNSQRAADLAEGGLDSRGALARADMTRVELSMGRCQALQLHAWSYRNFCLVDDQTAA